MTGTLASLRDALDEALAAARNDDVDVLDVGDQVADGGAVGRGDDLHRALGEAGVAQSLVHAGGDGLVAAQRLRSAAQYRRVAGLEAQRRGIGGDVGPRLVDDADHAERHAHPADLDAARAVLEIGDLADGVGQRGDLLEAVGHGADRPAASSVRRSTKAASCPAALAAATSCALAASSRASSRRIASAIARSAVFLAPVSARASSRAAARADAPTSRM